MAEIDCQFAESDGEEAAQLTPQQLYQQALSSVLSGVGMGALEARRRLAKDLDALMVLRHLRASGEVGAAQGLKASPEPSAELKVRIEIARKKYLRVGGVLPRYARLACRELARRTQEEQERGLCFLTIS